MRVRHICVVHPLLIRPRSSSRVTTCTQFSSSDVGERIDRVSAHDSPLTDSDQTHLCCKVLASLCEPVSMLLGIFEAKMAFKMS